MNISLLFDFYTGFYLSELDIDDELKYFFMFLRFVFLLLVFRADTLFIRNGFMSSVLVYYGNPKSINSSNTS